MKYILSVLFLFFFFSGFTQIYQEMPQYGYRANRMSFDSTLQIPTVCGVPTLKSVVSVNRKAAIAFDSCNNKFYTYNPKTLTWSEVSGGGATPSLQDVATVGNYYVNDNGDTLRLNSIDGNDKHPILWTSDQYGAQPNNILDFSYNSGFSDNVAKIKFGETSGLGTGYIEITDKESIFKNEISTRTIIQNGYNPAANNQTTYFPLMKGGTDTLATTEDIRNSAIDTANRFVNDVLKKNDSTITIYKGATATDITLTPSTTVASATRLTTIVYNNSGATITKGSVIYINGRHSSNLPTIALAKADSEDSSYATFALVQDDILNNNTGTIIQAGNISNLNLPTASFADGQVVYLSPTVAGGLTVDKTSVLAPNHIIKIGTITRAHPTFGSIEIRIENGWQMDELSDVQIPLYPNDSTLLQYSRVDSLWHSVGITNAIGSNYIKPSDTATMLTKYLRKTDTASLSSRIDLRVKYTDTATMLTPYIRSNTASATYLAKSDSTIYYTKYRSDTSRTNIYNALNGKQGTLTLTTTGTSGASTLVGNTLNIPQYSGGTSYTFSTGLTNTSGTITNNLSTGVAGGQSVVGGTAASNSLTLSSTSNATKGKILFGTSAYDEVNNRLGIGTASPSYPFHLYNGATQRSYITTTGQQAWFISDGTNEVGEIAYTTPSGFPGIITGTFSAGSYLNNRFDLINRGSSFRLGFDASNSGLGNLGIFNTGNVVISTSGMTDAGYKLDVNGTARASTSLQTPTLLGNTTSGGTLTLQSTSNATKGKILFGTSAYDEVNNRLGIGTASPSHPFHLTGSTTASSAIARGAYLNNTLVAAANNDVLSGLDITPTFTNGAFTGVGNYHIKLGSTIGISSDNQYSLNNLYFSGLTSNQGTSVIFRPNGTPTDFGYSFQFQKSSSANSNNLIIIGGGSVAAGTNAVNKHVISTSCDGTISAQPLVLRTAPSNTNWSTVNDHVTIFSTGNVVIQNSTTSATDAGYRLDVNGTARATQFQLSALNTAPATATSTGTTGEIRIDANYIYICTATNTWKRVAIATW